MCYEEAAYGTRKKWASLAYLVSYLIVSLSNQSPHGCWTHLPEPKFWCHSQLLNLQWLPTAQRLRGKCLSWQSNFHKMPPTPFLGEEPGFPGTLSLSVMVYDDHIVFLMETPTYHIPQSQYQMPPLPRASSLSPIPFLIPLKRCGSSLSENLMLRFMHFSHAGKFLMYPTWVQVTQSKVEMYGYYSFLYCSLC